MCAHVIHIPHMGRAETPQVSFADWLKSELEKRGWGIRTLARAIAANEAMTDSEVPRRAVNRYMRGSQPSEFYAAAIATALGVDRDILPVAEEAARMGDPFRGGVGRDVPAGGARGGSSRAGEGRVAA